MTDQPPAGATALSPTARTAALRRMAATHYDLLVVGGGVTGAGVALDAAVRGLSVALVEMRDFAAGTSGRSGKLIHGGLRYLEQLRFGLVAEALRERSLLLRRLAPHLVRPIQFLYPLRHRLWERAYVGCGLLLYDTLGGARALPRHRQLTRRAVARLAPALDPGSLAGALSFYDTQVDDSRHTLELVRTAAGYGADVAAAARVTGLVTGGGRVTGAQVYDAESGQRLSVRARQVVGAAGVWTDQLTALAGSGAGSGAGALAPFTVQASKGIHILVPRSRLDAQVSMFVRAEDSVLFIRAWRRHWLVGTTDTPWRQSLDHPAATGTDIDYLLRNLNRVLRQPLTRDDIDGVFAGLRPLVRARPGQPRRRSTGGGRTSRMTREHLVATVAPGYLAVTGGKYTTYRVMAADAVDLAVSELAGAGLVPAPGPSTTAGVPLLGAVGLAAARLSFPERAAGLGLTRAQAGHLLDRYGSLVAELAELLSARPELAAPVPGAEDYLAVEVVYAATHEGALHLDDVLVRRTHIAMETTDAGLAAAPAVAALLAGPLGWDERRTAQELRWYRARVEAERTARRQPDDATAMAAQDAVFDPRLVVADQEVSP